MNLKYLNYFVMVGLLSGINYGFVYGMRAPKTFNLIALVAKSAAQAPKILWAQKFSTARTAPTLCSQCSLGADTSVGIGAAGLPAPMRRLCTQTDLLTDPHPLELNKLLKRFESVYTRIKKQENFDLIKLAELLKKLTTAANKQDPETEKLDREAWEKFVLILREVFEKIPQKPEAQLPYLEKKRADITNVIKESKIFTGTWIYYDDTDMQASRIGTNGRLLDYPCQVTSLGYFMKYNHLKTYQEGRFLFEKFREETSERIEQLKRQQKIIAEKTEARK